MTLVLSEMSKSRVCIRTWMEISNLGPGSPIQMCHGRNSVCLACEFDSLIGNHYNGSGSLPCGGPSLSTPRKETGLLTMAQLSMGLRLFRLPFSACFDKETNRKLNIPRGFPGKWEIHNWGTHVPTDCYSQNWSSLTNTCLLKSPGEKNSSARFPLKPTGENKIYS